VLPLYLVSPPCISCVGMSRHSSNSPSRFWVTKKHLASIHGLAASVRNNQFTGTSTGHHQSALSTQEFSLILLQRTRRFAVVHSSHYLLFTVQWTLSSKNTTKSPISNSSKMLASRILPPLLWSSSNPPVATFYNIPRRYVKSNMQVGDDASHPSRENVDSSRNLRKSIRIQDSRIMPTSNPIQCTKEEDFPTSTSTSPRATKKRLSTSFDVEVNERETIDSDSPIDSRVHRSASSTEYGELSEHVCLCQPEPKIPRPRNGRSYFLFISDVDIPEPSPSYANKEMVFVCGLPHQQLISL